MDEAKAKLREAGEEIEKAQDQESFAATVYVTQAEIASFNLFLNAQEKETIDPEPKRILELVKLGVARGYKSPGQKTDLLFHLIESRYPELVNDIYIALRL